MNIAGIDYGSKLAGTTAIAAHGAAGLEFRQSKPKQDADRFILDWALEFQPMHIFLDAPLSLPGVYRDMEDCRDYFYRQGDRQAGAMSPMFLGGLTARAMQLAHELAARGIRCHEVYPAQLARILGLDLAVYKKDAAYLPAITQDLAALLPGRPPLPPLPSWHQVDALLALLSGFRFLRGEHLVFGDEAEGIIVV
jgi:predicted nuclease with RNAse H fold